MTQNCGNCKFLLEISETGGHCRRYPDTIVVNYHFNGAGERVPALEQHMPWKLKAEWCGEFKQKDPMEKIPHD